MFIDLLPLALGSAVSPAIFAAIILILSGSTKPFTRGLIYLAGALIPLVILTILVLVGSHSLNALGLRHTADSSGIDIAMSILLFLAGIYLLFQKKTPKQDHTNIPVKTNALLLKTFMLGFFMMATNLSSFAVFIPAEKDIFFSKHIMTTKIEGVLFLIFFTLLPMLIPLVFFMIDRNRAEVVLTPISQLVTKYGKHIAVSLCFIFSAYLLWKGLMNVHF